ncbi:DUF1275 family protein [Streptomyces sp. NPDC101234]|uniref:DUF1275 family protein n=1 Tax=Streptomyces sp. NPDC101234 TaxID=3366138 RepID=UPI00380FC5FA
MIDTRNDTLRQAWSTVVPDRQDRHGPLPSMMPAMTVVTGLDAYSCLVLGHVFVANMTGNIVFSGFALAGAAGYSLVASLVALAALALGAFLGGRIAHRSRVHRGRVLHRALILETVLIVGACALALNTGPAHAAASRYILIALLSVALGHHQNATGMASRSKVAGGNGGRAGRRLLSTAAIFVGALLGAVSLLSFRLTRSEAAWIAPL